ncbi:DedA family protein [Pararhodobacter sp.]|uniref:DedA family protein n=1 Tax=Pararhodobacter sp. TaxID=2127056 RepID=UPI002AFF9B78|nr:DedA family protein [Pararhodobacter sp.]
MISALVASYGYFAVFIGTLLEGETILIAAGYAAHRGLLDWPLVVVVAMAGGTLGDQLAFLLGRWRGEALFARFPALAQHRERVFRLLARYDVLFILSLRFMYGLRIAGPAILGSSPMSMGRFAFFNVMGAALWAVIIAGAGWFFGAALEAVLTDIKKIEEALLLAILVAGVGIWLWHRRRATAKVDRAD